MSDLVPAGVAALGVEALAEGYVRLVLDLRVADARELLQDVNLLNVIDARSAREAVLNGVELRKRPWRAIARDAASAAVGANPVATHHFSHAPDSLCTSGPWVHEISTKQAAAVLGCTVQNVHYLCRRKVIPARQDPSGRRAWTLDGEAVHAFAAARGRSSGVISSPGRPATSGR